MQFAGPSSGAAFRSPSSRIRAGSSTSRVEPTSRRLPSVWPGWRSGCDVRRTPPADRVPAGRSGPPGGCLRAGGGGAGRVVRPGLAIRPRARPDRGPRQTHRLRRRAESGVRHRAGICRGDGSAQRPADHRDRRGSGGASRVPDPPRSGTVEGRVDQLPDDGGQPARPGFRRRPPRGGPRLRERPPNCGGGQQFERAGGGDGTRADRAQCARGWPRVPAGVRRAREPGGVPRRDRERAAVPGVRRGGRGRHDGRQSGPDRHPLLPARCPLPVPVRPGPVRTGRGVAGPVRVRDRIERRPGRENGLRTRALQPVGPRDGRTARCRRRAGGPRDDARARHHRAG